jgi:hypothetical protein
MGGCHNCGQELVGIDNRGERLTGGITCNLLRRVTRRAGLGSLWKTCARCISCEMAEAAKELAQERSPALYGGHRASGSPVSPGEPRAGCGLPMPRT